jgi:hypothetical protein
VINSYAFDIFLCHVWIADKPDHILHNPGNDLRALTPVSGNVPQYSSSYEHKIVPALMDRDVYAYADPMHLSVL